ncbi:MAG: hypothetical protein DMD87_07555 [Candidatus Rokuibacteriota bacterium]|nr:MAG: hypothetical protein DMD87_07555 [Candidatus Rokubacteria bacterium]
MPWKNPNSYPFSMAAVVLNAPPESGVYALRSGTTWVYIGETGDVLAQLVQHLNGNNVCITMHADLSFSFELVPPIVRSWRLDDLVRELRPVCNPPVG